MKETLPSTTATERINYLRKNLPRETKDLYAENYDTEERNGRSQQAGQIQLPS